MQKIFGSQNLILISINYQIQKILMLYVHILNTNMKKKSKNICSNIRWYTKDKDSKEEDKKKTSKKHNASDDESSEEEVEEKKTKKGKKDEDKKDKEVKTSKDG